jgi:hydroxymethylglutaryl-CoA lyase
MPLVETIDQAQHFRRGAGAYAGCPSPWREPIRSVVRDAVEADRSRYEGARP